MLKIINFYNWYKGKFNDLSNNPPGEVWDTIAKALDKSQKPFVEKFLNWRMVAVLLFLITGSAALLFIFNIHSKQEFLTYNKNNKEIYELISQKKNKINQKEVTNSSTQFPINNLQSTISSTKYTISHPEGDPIHKIFVRNNVKISRLKKSSIQRPVYSIQHIAPSQQIHQMAPTLNPTEPSDDNHPSSTQCGQSGDSDISGESVSKTTPLKVLYFGTFFTFNNTWLLNHDTYNGLKSSELDETNIDFGNAYGLTVRYQFKDKLALQGEWLIHTSHRQKYKYYDQGKRNNKEITLKYTKFNLLVKYKRKSLTGRQIISANFIAGPYIGILNSAEKSVNGVSNSITYISKYDHGMVLGIEYETQIIKCLNLYSGIRINLGIKNIYTGEGNIPASFNKTTNSSLGITAGINYKIPIK